MPTKAELEQKVSELEAKLVAERKLRKEFKDSVIEWLSINYSEMCSEGREHIEHFCDSVGINVFQKVVLRVEAKTPFGIMPDDVEIYDENGNELEVDHHNVLYENTK